MGNAQVEVGCCCSRKEQGLLDELGLKNDQTSSVIEQKPQLLITKIQNRFSTFKKRYICNDNDDQQPQVTCYSQTEIVSKQQETLTHVKALNSFQEADPPQHLGSISSLSRNLGYEQDDCEMIQAFNFYSNGKYMLNLTEIKSFGIDQNYMSPTQAVSQRIENNVKSVFVHQKIFEAFDRQNPGLLNCKIAENQTLIIDYLDHSQSFNYLSPKQMREPTCQELQEKLLGILKKSRGKNVVDGKVVGRFNQIKALKRHYESPNAIVFKIEQPNFKNIVVKIPKDKRMVQHGLVEDLIFESQVQKLMASAEFMNEVKEEIVLINSMDSAVENYVVIQEEAATSLHDLQHYQLSASGEVKSFGLWLDEDASKELQEFWSLAKYLYYLYRSLQTIQYAHQMGIILNCLTPRDIVIDEQSQRVKFRNYAFCALTKSSLDMGQGNFEGLNGANKSDSFSQPDLSHADLHLKFYHEHYCSPVIVDSFQQQCGRRVLKEPKNSVVAQFLREQAWSEGTLLENDLHSLGQCFGIENVRRMLRGKRGNSEKLQEFLEKNVVRKMVAGKVYSLQELIDSIEAFYLENMKVSQSLIDQFHQESKLQGGIDVCSLSIDNLNQSQSDGLQPLQYQQNMIELYSKRARLKKVQSQPKLAIDDVKQALFIYSMHFPSQYLERAELTLQLVDLLIETQDFQDGFLKLQSASQLVQDNNLLSDAKLTSQLYSLYGKIYLCREEPQKSLSYFQEAFNQTQQILNEQSEEGPNFLLADSLKRIARAFKQKGQFDESKEALLLFYEEVIALYGEETIEHGMYLFEMAQVEMEQRNVDQAIKLMAHYLNIHRPLFSEMSSGRALIYNSLGMAFREKQYFQKAMGLIQKSLEIKLGIFGEKSLDTAMSYNNLGLLYKAQGQFDNALRYFLKDISIQETILGPQYPELATSYNNIGNVYKSLYNYDLAIEFYEKSLRLKMKTLKNNEYHLSIATTLQNLGLAYKGKEQFQKAVKYYRDSLKIKLKLLEKTHPSIANSYGSLAIAYLLMQKHDQALTYSKLELEILQFQYGEGDVNVAYCLQRIGNIYYGIGNNDSALTSLFQARDILKQLSPVKRTNQQRDSLAKIEQLISDCGGSLSKNLISPSMSDHSRSRKGFSEHGQLVGSPGKGVPMETTTTSGSHH